MLPQVSGLQAGPGTSVYLSVPAICVLAPWHRGFRWVLSWVGPAWESPSSSARPSEKTLGPDLVSTQ